jgi:hypothetical protein
MKRFVTRLEVERLDDRLAPTALNTVPLGLNGQPIPAFTGNTHPLGTTGQPPG